MPRRCLFPLFRLRSAIKSRFPQEWVELYLTVADICDGAEFDGEYQDLLNSAYQKIFQTPLGQRLYTEAVEDGSAFLRTIYGD